MKNSNRLLLILRFLMEQTDENHCTTIAGINEYLKKFDLNGDRATIGDCTFEVGDFAEKLRP